MIEGNVLVTEAHEMRELQEMIESAKFQVKRITDLNTRLSQMRRRLLGMDDPTDDAPKVAEAIGSELADLRASLAHISGALDLAEMYVSDLERV